MMCLAQYVVHYGDILCEVLYVVQNIADILFYVYVKTFVIPREINQY